MGPKSEDLLVAIHDRVSNLEITIHRQTNLHVVVGWLLFALVLETFFFITWV